MHMDAAKGIQQLPTRVDLKSTEVVLLTAIRESNKTHRVQSASIHEQDGSTSTGSQINENGAHYTPDQGTSAVHLHGHLPLEPHILRRGVRLPSVEQR